MAADLYVVPDEPEFGDGDGGGGDDDALEHLQTLAFLAQRIMEAHLAKIDWDALRPTADLITDDESDAATVVYLMSKAEITVEIADGQLD